VLAIDGTTLDVADTPANAAAFGRPKTHRGEQAAFPQVRVVGLAEGGVPVAHPPQRRHSRTNASWASSSATAQLPVR
jgi:hypothetical protein